MADVENVDIMLHSYSTDDERKDQSQKKLNLDSGSSRPQKSSTLP